MKITDSSLLLAIWHRQLFKTASGVVINYVGNQKAVEKIGSRKTWYKYACDIHFGEREKITDRIGKQQLRKRIVDLLDRKILTAHVSDCTFLLDIPEAMEAYTSAHP